MNRIEQAFEAVAAENRAALIVYLCAGDPSLALTPKLIVAAAESGADIVEVGMPFSDPTADGPTIQLASERALQGGATMARVLKVVAEARQLTEVPIVLFGYYNPILRYGEPRFCKDAADAGVDGLLVVDLPPEVAGVLLEPAEAVGLQFVPLLAPTSTPARVKKAASVAGAFIYYVSMTGVTGSAGADFVSAAARAKEIAAATGKRVAVGFGVRTGEDVAKLAQDADAVVVGSALVAAIDAERDDEARIGALRALVSELRQGTERAVL